MKKLTRAQWQQLDAQYSQTPPLDDHFAATGEHWILINLLNRFGFNPRSREAAMDLTERLLSNGYA
jgi:hypothetical protein